jgi:acetyl-CoA carboxylase carboxyltransferase component
VSKTPGKNKVKHHALSMEERTAELLERRAAVEKGGGEARMEKQHAQGKLTARERVLSLLDPGTFEETGMFARHQSTYFGLDSADYPADGVVTGEGAVLGRPVHVASQDFTVAGGSAGEIHSNKVAAMLRASLATGTPFVFINDSGGARFGNSPSVAARQHELHIGMGGREPRERAHETRHVLARFDRARERDERRGDTVARQRGEVG